jgi:hypothetical protein
MLLLKDSITVSRDGCMLIEKDPFLDIIIQSLFGLSLYTTIEKDFAMAQQIIPVEPAAVDHLSSNLAMLSAIEKLDQLPDIFYISSFTSAIFGYLPVPETCHVDSAAIGALFVKHGIKVTRSHTGAIRVLETFGLTKATSCIFVALFCNEVYLCKSTTGQLFSRAPNFKCFQGKRQMSNVFVSNNKTYINFLMTFCEIVVQINL